MTDFFLTEQEQANPGMVLHENTKNFRYGRRFVKQPQSLTSTAGKWLHHLVHTDSNMHIQQRRKNRCEIKTRNCLETFIKRRSNRAYLQSSLSKEILFDFLQLSYPEPENYQAVPPHGQIVNWNTHVTNCRLVVLIRNVSDLPSGAYLYDEQTHTLLLLKEASQEEITAVLSEHCFQREFIHAPAMFLQVGSFKECIDRYGERGYRYMLLEDGVQIQKMYLAATSLELGCCATGSLVQGELDAWLNFDGYNATILNAFVAGAIGA